MTNEEYNKIFENTPEQDERIRKAYEQMDAEDEVSRAAAEERFQEQFEADLASSDDEDEEE